MVEESGGEIPSATVVLVRLPSIGPYTAGAVACFAFERDVGSRLVLRTKTATSGLTSRRAPIRSAPLSSGSPRSRMAMSNPTCAAWLWVSSREPTSATTSWLGYRPSREAMR